MNDSVSSKAEEKLNTKVRDWYISTYPQDKLALSISENITFQDVHNTLISGQNVYKLIGVFDSMIRENIFTELATIMNVDYNYIYRQWLLCDGE